MKNFYQTRDVVKYSLKYISGKTLDVGSGSAKYKSIITQKTSDYITFDMVAGENVDVVGSVYELPFEDNSMDTVISTQVLEHVEKPWLMIKEIKRVLKKDGHCILSAPFLSPYHADPNDYFRYTESGMKSLFNNEDFEIVECHGYGKTFYVISDFIRFLYFNAYKKTRRGSLRITRLLGKTASFLDRFSKNKIIYANVYIVAKA